MFKRIGKKVVRQLRYLKPVKEYASRMEAELAAEVLRIYHVNAQIVGDHLDQIAEFYSWHIHRNRVLLMVPAVDYQRASRLLRI